MQKLPQLGIPVWVQRYEMQRSGSLKVAFLLRISHSSRPVGGTVVHRCRRRPLFVRLEHAAPARSESNIRTIEEHMLLRAVVLDPQPYRQRKDFA